MMEELEQTLQSPAIVFNRSSSAHFKENGMSVITTGEILVDAATS